MKTNILMDEIRQSTPPEVTKQVDLCVSIANRIYTLLEERGMSQRDFAKVLGKTETEVSRWLSGTHNLTIATIAKMAVALGDDIIKPTSSVNDECASFTHDNIKYNYVEEQPSRVAEDY